MTETVERFWQRYLATLPPDHPHRAAAYTAWAFGDGPALADELAALVCQGIKTGTAGLLWEYEFDGDPIPQPGELNVILDGSETPVALTETVSVETLPFNAVGAEHAYSEGEGDRSLADWRDGHWRFFVRSCTRIGRTPDETMPIVCERFRLLFTA
ncbi:MAG TPA: ASCH domain-containing protein [Aggregatilinea sp.]|uniref:ASCH domain-containing protein n=1 Tax=Aggregatilinea sp. TaxID=2806333 RepID=UPI002D1A0470|nr:ASCH domain-containing protein [Aggregatilinea sp.]HML24127.1 ASCH domain-containing protein [Aggregatilinea sp.]